MLSRKNTKKYFVVIAVVGLLLFLLTKTDNFIKNFLFSQLSFWQKKNYSFAVFISPKCSPTKNEDNIKEKELNKILVQENQELKKTLNFLNDNGYLKNEKKLFFSSYVLGRDPLWQNVYLIKGGQEEGVEEGMPVIRGEGILVGEVIKTEKDFSYFRLITDNNTKLLAEINKEKDEPILGIIEGDFQLTLKMNFIPLDKDVEVGDVVVTAGENKKIPEGLIIGKVTAVFQKDNDIFQTAQVVPYQPLDRIRFITILQQ